MAIATISVTLDASDFLRELKRVQGEMASMRAAVAPDKPNPLPAIALAAVAAGSTRRVTRRGLLGLSWLGAPSRAVS